LRQPPRSVFWVMLIGSDLVKYVNICKEINAPKHTIIKGKITTKRVMDLRPKV